jgi:5-bromo-4-chloroindolyl phosphate hydrolysis protein
LSYLKNKIALRSKSKRQDAAKDKEVKPYRALLEALDKLKKDIKFIKQELEEIRKDISHVKKGRFSNSLPKDEQSL